MTSIPGPLFLYSTSPRPAFADVIGLTLARHDAGRNSLRLVFLQTPLEQPSLQETNRLREDLSGFSVEIDVTDPGLHDRADAFRSEVIAAILEADIVLGSGGDPTRMARVLRDTPALDALREANANGTVVGGGSAGAMVFGAGLLDGPRDNPYPTPLLGWLPDVVVAPHFGNYPIDPWRTAFPMETILGLSDGSGVVVTESGEEFTVVGEAPVTFLVPGHEDMKVAPGNAWKASHAVDIDQPHP